MRYKRGQGGRRLAQGKGLNDITFSARWQTGDTRSAVDFLVDTERASEAGLLARDPSAQGALAMRQN